MTLELPIFSHSHSKTSRKTRLNKKQHFAVSEGQRGSGQGNSVIRFGCCLLMAMIIISTLVSLLTKFIRPNFCRYFLFLIWYLLHNDIMYFVLPISIYIFQIEPLAI